MNTERWAGQDMEIRRKGKAATGDGDMKETTLRYESDTFHFPHSSIRPPHPHH